MAAYLFSRLERFREESLAQIDNHESHTQSLSYPCRYRAASAAKKHNTQLVNFATTQLVSFATTLCVSCIAHQFPAAENALEAVDVVNVILSSPHLRRGFFKTQTRFFVNVCRCFLPLSWVRCPPGSQRTWCRICGRSPRGRTHRWSGST